MGCYNLVVVQINSKSTKEKQPESESASARLLAALDLMELGISIMRQNIVRKNPGAPAEKINAELQAWLEK